MSIYYKAGAVWKPARAYVKHSGVWKFPRPYVKRSGVWTPLYALQPLSRTLVDLSLGTNLKLCLDAGDIASIPSSSPAKWLDTSGGGYDFNRSTVTVNGVPGGLSGSEYLSFSGSNALTYDSANEAWMQNLHKASLKFTVAGWFYVATMGGSQVRFAGTRGTTGGVGFGFLVTTSALLNVDIRNGGSQVANLSSTAFTAPFNEWVFLAASMDSAAGATGGLLMKNGTQEVQDASFTGTPSTGNASQTMQIGAGGGDNSIMSAGSRFGQMAMWEGRALTAAELQMYFQTTRDRYGV